jgi:hypothetical protein
MTSFQISEADVLESGNGICLDCGEIQYGGIEPDARDYPCDSCGKHKVYGLEEAVLMGRAYLSAEAE